LTARRRRPRRRSRPLAGRGGAGGALATLLAVLLSVPASARAAEPGADSAAGARAALDLALEIAASMPRGSTGRPPAEGAAGACAAPDAGACPVGDPPACARALAGLLDALAEDAGADDTTTRDLAVMARILIANAASRLAWWSGPGDAGCRVALAPRDVEARVTLGPDPRTLRVRPLRPLRFGRAYRVVVHGLPDAVPVAWSVAQEDGVVRSPGPDGDAERAEAAIVARYDATFGGREVEFRDADARALLRRLGASLADVAGGSPTAAVEGTLARPLSGEELVRLRARFVPVARGAGDAVAGGPGADAGAGPVVRVVDARDTLAAYRAVVAEPCAAVRVAPADVGIRGAAVAAVYRGRFPSRDVTGGAGSARLLGVPPADAREVERPFLLALPRDAGPETPLVLAVHGHGGRAEAMVKAHAIGLARRGIATLALDLPGHGERAGEGDFVDPLDPARLTLGLRQAAVDALAAVASVRCGFVLPDGRAWRPGDVRYLGYSMGAMVGVLVRSVEPRLGAMVLLAPVADFEEWQVLQLPKRLGAERYTACSGGPAHGELCLTTAACEPGGVCGANPELVLLRDLVTPAYGAVYAAAEPAGFAAERTGPASTAPLLLIGGGMDMGVGPHAAGRLAEAYGMRPAGDGARRGTARLVVWPGLGHDLLASEDVREQAYDFLATRGRRVRRAAPTAPAPPAAR